MTSSRPVRTTVPESRLNATGGWVEGMPFGDRQVRRIGTIYLDAGGSLPDVTMAYETFGELNADRSNAILIAHALTGDTHVTSHREEDPAGPGWWHEIVGPGRAIDTDKYFVLVPNVLGGCQGTTGPSSLDPSGQQWGSRFPVVTVRDQVAAELALADRLGIDSFASVIGGSMGGHRALEWAIAAPNAVDSVVVIASGAYATADQIAWAHQQIGAIEMDPAWRGGDYYDAPPGRGPHRGLGIARQIAHTTYRTAEELDLRFGRIPQHAEEPLEGGRYAVQSYLDHHANKLAARFDAGSYVTLTRSMITHDVGRDRGGIQSALASITAPTLVVSIDSDRLFLHRDSEKLAAALPGAELAVINSPHGHDAFLVEAEQMTAALRPFLRTHTPVR